LRIYWSRPTTRADVLAPCAPFSSGHHLEHVADLQAPALRTTNDGRPSATASLTGALEVHPVLSPRAATPERLRNFDKHHAQPKPIPMPKPRRNARCEVTQEKPQGLAASVGKRTSHSFALVVHVCGKGATRLQYLCGKDPKPNDIIVNALGSWIARTWGCDDETRDCRRAIPTTGHHHSHSATGGCLTQV
jgi:hypothetical protein